MKKFALLTFCIFSILLVVYFDAVVEKSANLYLSTLSTPYQIQVSQLKLSPLKGEASFALSARNPKTGKEILNFPDVALDRDLNLLINGGQLTITPDLISQAPGPQQDSKLQWGEVQINNLDYSVPAIHYKGTIEKVYFNPDQKLGFINQIAGGDNFQIKRIDFRDGEARVKDLKIKVTKSLLERFKSLEMKSSTHSDGLLKKIHFLDSQITYRSYAFWAREIQYFLGNKDLSMDIISLHLLAQGFKIHSESFKYNIPTGELQVIGLRSQLLKTGKQFLKVSSIQGKYHTGAEPDLRLGVSEMDLILGPEELAQFKRKRALGSKRLTLPFTISNILIGDSSLELTKYEGVGDEEHLKFINIFGNIRNLSFEDAPLTDFSLNAAFDDSSKVIFRGRLNLGEQPKEWRISWKLFDLDINQLNKYWRSKIPLNFEQGELELFGEAMKKDNKVVGYLKPFIQDAKYFGNDKKWKGPIHYIKEKFKTFTSWLFENQSKGSVATTIPFTFENGKFSTDAGNIVWDAFKHGVLQTDKVERGIEDKYRLKQAQEAEE